MLQQLLPLEMIAKFLLVVGLLFCTTTSLAHEGESISPTSSDAIKLAWCLPNGLLQQLGEVRIPNIVMQSVRQRLLDFELIGYASANTRVTTYIQAWNHTASLFKPDLISIRSYKIDDRPVNQFTLIMQSLWPLNDQQRHCLPPVPPPSSANDVDAILDIVQAWGKARELKFSLFQPRTLSSDGVATWVPVTMAFSGTYAGISEFVQDVMQAPSLMVFDDLDMALREDQWLELHAILRIYITPR